MGLFRSSEFSSGTRILFQQSTAPVGWTKDTTHNDKSLRVVSGAVSSGGSVDFSTFTAQAVGATTLSTAQMPSHDHDVPFGALAAVSPWGQDGRPWYGGRTGFSGGSQSHTHSLDMSLKYVDTVICVKN